MIDYTIAWLGAAMSARRACALTSDAAMNILPITMFIAGVSFLAMSSLVEQAIAEVVEQHPQSFGAVAQLETSEILKTFSNTLDRGAVQNRKGISAETRWLSSGHFETRWWLHTGGASKMNVISGRWRAENNKRCVLFDAAPENDWQCTPLFQRADGAIVSLNEDGSVHGIHQIAPLDFQGKDPH